MDFLAKIHLASPVLTTGATVRNTPEARGFRASRPLAGTRPAAAVAVRRPEKCILGAARLLGTTCPSGTRAVPPAGGPQTRHEAKQTRRLHPWVARVRLTGCRRERKTG